MKQLELIDPDGQPAVIAFENVGPDQLSPPWTGTLRNSGDEALTGPLAWVEQTPTPGELRVTVNGVLITAATQQTAQTLPALAPGASLPVTIAYYGQGVSDWGEACFLPQ